MIPSDTPTQPAVAYTPPRIVVMSEEDMLRTFQVTSAQGGWWQPGCVTCSM